MQKGRNELKKVLLSKEGPELKDLGNSQPILCKNRRKCVVDENIKGVDQQPRDKKIGTGVSHGLNQLQQQEHCQFSSDGVELKTAI